MFLATNMCLCVDWENTWKEAMFFACRMSAMFYMSKLNSLHADNECRWQAKNFRIKCCIIIWIQHEKCIKMSTNKPCMGAEFLEIAPRILWKKIRPTKFSKPAQSLSDRVKKAAVASRGHGGICPPIRGSSPYLTPPIRRKKWSKSGILANFGIFALSEMYFSPSIPPTKKKFLVQEGLLKWQPVGNPAQRPFLFGPCQLQYTC